MVMVTNIDFVALDKVIGILLQHKDSAEFTPYSPDSNLIYNQITGKEGFVETGYLQLLGDTLSVEAILTVIKTKLYSSDAGYVIDMLKEVYHKDKSLFNELCRKAMVELLSPLVADALVKESSAKMAEGMKAMHDKPNEKDGSPSNFIHFMGTEHLVGEPLPKERTLEYEIEYCKNELKTANNSKNLKHAIHRSIDQHNLILSLFGSGFMVKIQTLDSRARSQFVDAEIERIMESNKARNKGETEIVKENRNSIMDGIKGMANKVKNMVTPSSTKTPASVITDLINGYSVTLTNDELSELSSTEEWKNIPFGIIITTSSSSSKQCVIFNSEVVYNRSPVLTILKEVCGFLETTAESFYQNDLSMEAYVSRKLKEFQDKNIVFIKYPNVISDLAKTVNYEIGKITGRIRDNFIVQAHVLVRTSPGDNNPTTVLNKKYILNYVTNILNVTEEEIIAQLKEQSIELDKDGNTSLPLYKAVPNLIAKLNERGYIRIVTNDVKGAIKEIKDNGKTVIDIGNFSFGNILIDVDYHPGNGQLIEWFSKFIRQAMHGSGASEEVIQVTISKAMFDYHRTRYGSTKAAVVDACNRDGFVYSKEAIITSEDIGKCIFILDPESDKPVIYVSNDGYVVNLELLKSFMRIKMGLTGNLIDIKINDLKSRGVEFLTIMEEEVNKDFEIQIRDLSETGFCVLADSKVISFSAVIEKLGISDEVRYHNFRNEKGETMWLGMKLNHNYPAYNLSSFLVSKFHLKLDAAVVALTVLGNLKHHQTQIDQSSLTRSSMNRTGFYCTQDPIPKDVLENVIKEFGLDEGVVLVHSKDEAPVANIFIDKGRVIFDTNIKHHLTHVFGYDSQKAEAVINELRDQGATIVSSKMFSGYRGLGMLDRHLSPWSNPVMIPTEVGDMNAKSNLTNKETKMLSWDENLNKLIDEGYAIVPKSEIYKYHEWLLDNLSSEVTWLEPSSEGGSKNVVVFNMSFSDIKLLNAIDQMKETLGVNEEFCVPYLYSLYCKANFKDELTKPESLTDILNKAGVCRFSSVSDATKIIGPYISQIGDTSVIQVDNLHHRNAVMANLHTKCSDANKYDDLGSLIISKIIPCSRELVRYLLKSLGYEDHAVAEIMLQLSNMGVAFHDHGIPGIAPKINNMPDLTKLPPMSFGGMSRDTLWMFGAPTSPNASRLNGQGKMEINVGAGKENNSSEQDLHFETLMSALESFEKSFLLSCSLNNSLPALKSFLSKSRNDQMCGRIRPIEHKHAPEDIQDNTGWNYVFNETPWDKPVFSFKGTIGELSIQINYDDVTDKVCVTSRSSESVDILNGYFSSGLWFEEFVDRLGNAIKKHDYKVVPAFTEVLEYMEGEFI